MSYENLVDPTAVFSFPKNFAEHVSLHEYQSRRISMFDEGHSLNSSPPVPDKVAATAPRTQVEELKFFDIDDLALIPFDSVDC